MMETQCIASLLVDLLGCLDSEMWWQV